MLKFNNGSDMVSQDDNKRKKRKKTSKLKIVAFIFIGIIFLYLGAALFEALSSNLSTTVALGGSVTEEVRVDGYVFRDQSIIDAPWTGHFESLVSEGERVREGQVIGYIYQTQPDSKIVEEIKKVHRMIRLSGTNEDLSLAGTGAAEKNISALARDLSDIRQERDLSAVLDKKEEINVLMKRRQNVASVQEEVTEDKAALLEGELSRLETEAGVSIKITAPSGGVFSSRIDGMEEALAYDAADAVTPYDIEELDKTEISDTNDVVAGHPLCKIINNYVWRYVAVISEKQAEKITSGQSVEMRFYDLASGGVSGTVSRISEPQGGKCAVVVSTNKYVDGIYSSSRANADIITVNARGIKLPAGCLRVKDGNMGVYVIRLDEAKFVPVNLVHKNDDWAIVTAAEPELGGAKLQMYDEVIVECRNLEDGKIVR